MKRTHVHRTPVLACTAALVSMVWFLPAAYAQSVQLYGTADVAVGQLANQNPGAPTTGVTEIRGVHNGALQTSYIGFRGSEDLGGGLSARFQLESFLRVDTGQPGRADATPTSTGDFFWSRSAFVGLAGSLGELRLGTNGTPLWLAMVQTNAMGANSVFSPSFRQLYNGGTRSRSVIDSAMVNSVSYQTPVLAGLSMLAVVQADEGRGGDPNYGAHLVYRSGPAVAAVAVQRARHLAQPNIPTNADQDMALVGAAYNLGFARVFAQFTRIDNVGNTSTVPSLGVTIPLAGGTLQLAAAEDKNKVLASGAETQRKTASLGYVYGLSRRTDLYSFAMRETFPVIGPGPKSGNSLVQGMRHVF